MITLTNIATRFAQIKNCTIDQAKNDPTCQTTLPTISANTASVQKILGIAFAVIGAMTVIFIIITAIRFVLSEGRNPRLLREFLRRLEDAIFDHAGLDVFAHWERVGIGMDGMSSLAADNRAQQFKVPRNGREGCDEK